MTLLSKDNIVVRALLNVLDPSAEQLDACAKSKHVPLKRNRVGVRAAVVEACSRPASRPAHIAVMERLSAVTISVSWSDSRSGRYTEQIWCSGIARATSVCALTGRTIRHGDRIFRPRTRATRVPIHQDQMILAETIEHRNDLPIEGVVTYSV
jgi:hypothetical protein